MKAANAFYRLAIFHAVLAIVGVLYSFAVLAGLVPKPSDLVAFASTLGAFPGAPFAMRPRSGSERIASGAPLGLHRSNYRKVLIDWSTPFSAARKSNRGVSRLWWWSGSCLLLLGFYSNFLLAPFALVAAFALLRRAAHAGNQSALSIEQNWLKMRYPTRQSRSDPAVYDR